MPGTISTWAGGTGEGPATNLAVRPDELASRGPLVYIADERHHQVRVLDTRTGDLRTIAGTGDQELYLEQTPRNDGGPATASRLDTLTGVAVDGSGRVALSDSPDNRVRQVDTSGIITTIAGGGHPPDGDASGDGLQATQATILGPTSLVFDQSGNLFAVDDSRARVRKIATSGVISTVAGGRCFCTVAPEDAPAVGTAIKVNAMAVDATGHLHIATGFQVLKIDDAGILRRVVGTPESQLDRGDGGPATQATLAGAGGAGLRRGGQPVHRRRRRQPGPDGRHRRHHHHRRRRRHSGRRLGRRRTGHRRQPGQPDRPRRRPRRASSTCPTPTTCGCAR